MGTQQLRFWFTRDRLSCSKGEACGEERPVCQVAAASEEAGPIAPALMEEVVRRENLVKALKRVRANKGSPGIDGMTVETVILGAKIGAYVLPHHASHRDRCDLTHIGPSLGLFGHLLKHQHSVTASSRLIE